MPKRWAIQVVYPDGRVAFLRHGSRIGYGPLATFASRKLADINREMVAAGLDDGTVARVVDSRVAAADRRLDGEHCNTSANK